MNRADHGRNAFGRAISIPTGLPGSVVFCLAGLLSSMAPAGEGEDVPVGVARIDITPDGPIRLHGYLGRDAESQGVQQRIWAKALAIGADDPGAAVLVSVDNLGVPAEITAEVAERLNRRVGLARDRLTIASSHTHSAPCLTGVAPNIFGKPIPADQQDRIDRYTRGLVDQLERVCLDALADRRPGRLAWSRGKVGFAENRRTQGGPVDHDFPALKVEGPDGTLRAIVANYACHCTTLDPKDNLVSGDWAGAAQEAIEADHPGCIALTLIGCGADAYPVKRTAPGVVAAHGRAIADEVNRLLRGPWTALSGTPEIAVERYSLPFDTLPTREDLQRLVQAGGPPGYNASVHLARLDRGEELPSKLPYSTQAWRFGDELAMVFLPGEVVVDYVLRLKRELDPGRLWVTAYANDVPCYIPSERILREGGYEAGGAMVYYGWPTRLRPGVEQVIIDAVHRVVGGKFGTPEPPSTDPERPPPRSTDEALRSFRLPPGLKMELVAAEPLVESPVAIDFGADGRLWVCEMRDYPAGIDGQGKPGGAIKVLEDRDRDGRYETATVFLDGLPFPTGVMAWRKGVLVCAAPEILYAEDTDGDGKADVRRTLFRGFATENFQARVNGLAYGLDNWVYGANGLIGGTIHGTASGREIDIGGRDFRIKPDTGEFEPASGLTQQGRVRDDWGHQFGGSNTVLIQHYPLPDHYAGRNPRVAAPAPAVVLARDPELAQLFPASRTLARYNEPEYANRVTSACSPLVHRDPLLGTEYQGNAFVCEPVHNLIRRLVLEPDGVTFVGHRAPGEERSEFFASTDSWCRPVQVRTGPDGALWVVDMYRFVIEHPRWISPDRLATLVVRAGAKMGRIYRIVPDGRSLRAVPRLDELSTRDLAAALDSPNGTLRDMIQRVLVHRGDPTAAAALADLARDSTLPGCRAQALGTLDGLGALEPQHLRIALGDPHPGVRCEAVRLAEPRLAKDETLGRLVLGLADDPEARVRFQVALSLGAWSGPESGQALGRLAVRDGSDTWVRAAVLSSATPHAGAILDAVIAAAGAEGPSPALVEPLLATIAGARDRQAIARALAALRIEEAARPELWRLGAVAQLLEADRDGELANHPAVKSSITAARALASDHAAPAAVRATALRLLGLGRADRDLIAERLAPSEPAEVQLAALRALAGMGDRESADAIIARWPGLGPSQRAMALDALLARDRTAAALLDALEDGRIAPSLIDAAHREALLEQGSEERRQRAGRVLGQLAIGPRKAVLDAYASAKSQRGDPARGKAAFERVCSACHKIGETGHEVGPDLAALTDTSPDALMIAILDPNRDVDARYASYTAAMKDGRLLTGLMAAETGSAISLKRQEGGIDEVLRADLEELATSGRSLMPEGLENDLTPDQLADVIAFLAGGAARPKELAGNRPQTVPQGADGSIRLTAATAEVYGPTLTFETEFGNLGYWHQPADRAAWTLQVDRPATFTASLEWACDDASAGNRYSIRVGDTTVRRVVGGTGSWSSYQSIFLQEVTLKPGVHRLEMRPDGPIRGALADVRAIVLTPRRLEPPKPVAPEPRPDSADDLARAILDPAKTDAEREALLKNPSVPSAELVAALARGLGDDRKEEYRRIPWIWRVAIAAGRRNDADELERLLVVALPEATAPLTHWQAVVLGGGIINGITQAGPWPGERIADLLRDDPALRLRWEHALELAATMADDPSVPNGTRYDALRMIGLEPWDRRGAQIVRYLAEGIDPELQQGAVSALGDLRSPAATQALLTGLPRYTASNRKLAIAALLRDDERRNALLDAVEAGRVMAAELSEDQRDLLVDPDRNRSHERAGKLLAK
jgi:putative membrane-bound dehydrogenase-like protein